MEGALGGAGPDHCNEAFLRHMSELVPVHAALLRLPGGKDRAAQFLSTCARGSYLGG